MNPTGYYLTCDDAICSTCWDMNPTWDGFEGWSEPLAIFSDTESDSPTHCHKCDNLIQHKLTPDGLTYVLETISDAINDGKFSRRVHSVTWSWAREWFPTLYEHLAHDLLVYDVSEPPQLDLERLQIQCADCFVVWPIDDYSTARSATSDK